MSFEQPSEVVPVLIVGGSLVGLSLAMFLAARGVQCVLVERHRGSSIHPRARGFTQRSVEMFNAAGLRHLPQMPSSAGGFPRRVRTQSMVAEPTEEIAWTPEEKIHAAPDLASARSPNTGAALAQDRIEPLLRQRALELGATLHLGTELLRFEEQPDGVVVWLKDPQGEVHTIRARYLIGCDGNHSLVREGLGIARRGIGLIKVMRSVLFRADLERFRRGIAQWEIKRPGLDAFLAGYGDGRWVLMFRDDIERDEAIVHNAIQEAIGAPVDVEIITSGRWELTALIAERFRKGRVFLAGDAAHTLPPSRGGYGANTGIADAFNLAWKLAAVVSGQARESLLESYEAERMPIAWMRFQQIFARPDYAPHVDESYRTTALLDPVAIELGERYQSSIIDGSGSAAELPLARLPEEWQGEPGTRAPHRVVTRDGATMSTLDLYGGGWVLLSSSDAWCEAAACMEDRTGIPVQPINLRRAFGGDVGALVEQDLGIDEQGASLIRPDGVIAWRSIRGGGSVHALIRVMEKVSQPYGNEGPGSAALHSVRPSY